MFEYLFDSNWNQRSDIESLKRDARRRARSRSANEGRKSRRAEELEGEVARLNLVTTALLEHLRGQPGWNEEAFRQTLSDVDIWDGELDGKLSIEKKPKPKAKAKPKPRPKPVTRKSRLHTKKDTGSSEKESY